MKFLLPPDAEGNRRKLASDSRTITIIGANGTGKSRFTDYLAKSLGEKAQKLSALKAVYVKDESSDDAVDIIYREASRKHGFLSNGGSTTFERLIALLLNDEIAELIRYKGSKVDNGNGRLPETKLDRVIAIWQELFPDNRIHRNGGELLFTREGEDDTYPQLRLSTGEKTVLYYIGAMLYIPQDSVVFVDSPEMFLHPSLRHRIWERIELMRPDCTFVFTTHDLDFTAFRQDDTLLWVKGFNPTIGGWDYAVLPRGEGISDEVYMSIIGSRNPILFIEGDASHSIDAKLYPLIFRDFTVKSIGSCDKVIESTRTFNDQKNLHNLESHGIVDRDRRDSAEVAYLRTKNIYVPDVAEIENILMLEDVVRTVARVMGRNDNKVFESVKRAVINMFSHDLRMQAMMHTRHRIKRLMERRVDGKFSNINDYERHLAGLAGELNPRGTYEKLCREFSSYVADRDYQSVLRVYNQKSMLPGSNVSQLCGLNGSKEAYIDAIISILQSDSPESDRIRKAIIRCFGLEGSHK